MVLDPLYQGDLYVFVCLLNSYDGNDYYCSVTFVCVCFGYMCFLILMLVLIFLVVFILSFFLDG